jgi:hypothetical protein
MRSLGAAAIVGLAVGWTVPGCSSSNNGGGGNPDATPGGDGGPGRDATPGMDVPAGSDGGVACSPTGSGNPTAPATAVAMSGMTSFWSPFNSIPSPDGNKIYFVADGPTGTGVFSVAATGGSATPLLIGDPFQTPIDIQISTDGNTLFIVDVGAETSSRAAGKQGRIFSMSSSGGTPTPISEADGTEPRGIDVVRPMGSSTDVIWWTGIDPMDGMGAVYKMNADGSMMMTAHKGDFSEGGGIAVTRTGDAYFVDSGAGFGVGTIYKLSGMTLTAFVKNVALSFPAGIALSADETVLLVSELDPATKKSVIGRYKVTDATRTSFNMGIEMTDEPAGLHRARCADVYTWAHESGCADCAAGQGGIYILKGQ